MNKRNRLSHEPTADRFALALSLHQQGKIDEASRLYREILRRDSQCAGAHHYLGVAAIQRNDYAVAIKLIGKALAIEPDVALAHSNLGHALLLNKDYAVAIDSFSQAVQLDPQLTHAYYNRGNALRELGRFEEAVVDYDRAVVLQPGFVDAYNNRGLALYKLGRLNDALASYDSALRFAPRLANAWSNRGNTLRDLKKPRDALASYERALQINPQFAEAYNNSGMALRDLRELDAALRSFDRALEIKSEYVDAVNNRANILMDLKRHEEAAAAYAKVLRLAPADDYTLGSVLWSRRLCCDWADDESVARRVTDDLKTGRRLHTPFTALFATDNEAVHLLCAREFAARHRPRIEPFWRGERYAHERIRVAYLSADFHDHATAYLAAELFERHDRKRFETVAVSFGPDSDSAMRRRLRQSFDRFLDVRSYTDVEAARMLREMEVDIAVDLKGFTGGHRVEILAHRPAPIQVNYLGYPGTMGADFIDYLIADREVIPSSAHANFSERVVYLPHCYQPNDSTREIAAHTPTRAEAGLPDNGFVFGCFNVNYKITPALFDVWMRLLIKCPGSVLWLLDGGETVRRNLRTEAARRDVDPQRLIFAPHLELAGHLARVKLADLFLDTLPISAHTTASDALWAGLPVLTCRGRSFAGRVAASLLRAIGLPELIADNLEEYEALALKLASTPAMLGEIRGRLGKNRRTEPLFDTEKYCRHLEAAYVEMWQRYQRGEAPTAFAVSELRSVEGDVPGAAERVTDP